MLRRAMSFLGKQKAAEPLGPEAFREKFLRAIVEAEPELTIEVTGPLTFVIAPEHEQPYPVDLTKLRAVYDLDPARLETLVSLHTNATLQMLTIGSLAPTPDMLVPLLRTTAEAAGVQPAAGQPEPVNAELVAMYALDLPGELALVDDGHMLLLGLQPEDLAAYAAQSMDGLADAAQIDIEDGVAAITAEGGNASSFVFSITLWEQGAFAELDTIAVLAPERDLLLAYDPTDEVAAENAQAIAKEVYEASESPLSLTRMIVKGVDPALAVAPEPEPEPEPEPLPAPAPEPAPAPRRAIRPTADAPAAAAPPAAADEPEPVKAAAPSIPVRVPRNVSPDKAPQPPIEPAPTGRTNSPNSIRQLAANMRRTG